MCHFPQVQVYLKDTWIPTLQSSIKTSLDMVSKGWYNMHESSFEVYQGSKLKKLMELIKFSMQVRNCIMRLPLKILLLSLPDSAMVLKIFMLNC